MFISSRYLINNYGVDSDIARFFVDREPPENNLYWQGKLMYLRPAPGYLFIPLIVDLLFKLGIEKEQLLSEDFVCTMEAIGHISALEETTQISAPEGIDRCAALVEYRCHSQQWFNQLKDYFANIEGNSFAQLKTPFKALHRGDVFLYAMCSLKFADDLMPKIVEQWFALISTVLLLDDAEDVKIDQDEGEENAFLESGLTKQGIGNILILLKKSLNTIITLNRSMAMELDQQFEDLLKQPHIISLLNQLAQQGDPLFPASDPNSKT